MNATRAAEVPERYSNGAAYHVARAHAWRGEKEEAFRWLERAYLQHDTALYAIRPDPLLASLHKDARFAALLKTLGLPP